MAIDRRVTRTRSMLHKALFSLIMEKGYDAVSIKDICDAANVGRTTFYAHFPSKDALKRSGLEHLRKGLVDRQKAAIIQPDENQQIRLGFSLPMFEHARDHLHLYRALIGSRGGAIALDTIREIISDLVRDEITESSDTSKAAVPRELTVQHVVGAYMAVLSWWLDGGAKMPIGQVDAHFRQLAIYGAASADGSQAKTLTLR